ncbi:MAG TPA: hypothetical protein ENN33_05755, partial [Ignavibacteria bacterium]|nr:hypothetical protein [Ignavibacteria bacterium]
MNFTNIYFLFLFLSTAIFSQQFKLIGPPGGSIAQKQFGLNFSNPKVIYIAQSNGSLVKSIDGTSNINSVEVGFGNFSNQKIWLSPENTNVLFINNLFYLKTTDGGNNWNVLNAQAYRQELTFNPIDADIIYYSDHSELY